MRRYRTDSRISRFLIVGLIGLICFVASGTDSYCADEIVQGQAAPYSGIMFNDDYAGKLLKDLSRIPILEDANSNCLDQVATLKTTCGNEGEQVKNLNEQIEKYKQLNEIEKAKTQLEHDRAEFYKEQGVAKDKLIDQYSTLNEKLLKEAEKKTFWKSLAIGELLAVLGLIVGLAL